jgi:rRNA-processing protein FCF1
MLGSREGRRAGRSNGRAGPANSADDEIVRLVTTDAHPEEILVATSDRNLSDRVRAAGAAVYPAERLRNLIDPD